MDFSHNTGVRSQPPTPPPRVSKTTEDDNLSQSSSEDLYVEPTTKHQPPIPPPRVSKTTEDDNLSQSSSEDLYLEPTDKHQEERYEEISPSFPEAQPTQQMLLPRQQISPPLKAGRPPAPLPQEIQDSVPSEYVMETDVALIHQRSISVTSEPGYSPGVVTSTSNVVLRQKSEGAEPSDPQLNTTLPKGLWKRYNPSITNDQKKIVNTVVLRNTRANLKPVSEIFKNAQNREVRSSSVYQTEHREEQSSLNLLQQLANRKLDKIPNPEPSQHGHVQQGYEANHEESNPSGDGSVSGWRRAFKSQPLSPPPTESSPVQVNRIIPPPPTESSLVQAAGRVEDEEWYFQVERSEVEDKLQRIDGMFLVRPSRRAGSNAPYTLCVYHDGRVYNLNIRQRHDKKYALGTPFADEETFDTVSELIYHCRRNPIKLVDSDPVLLISSPPRDDIYDQTM